MTLLTILFSNYLLGSLVAALFLKNKLNLKNVTSKGSKNPGATNVWRTNGLAKALVIFAFDLLKAAIPLLIISSTEQNITYIQLSAIALVVGHIYPVLYNFKGGKGFATYMGCWMVLSPYYFFIAFTQWILVSYLTKKAALSTFISLALGILYCFFYQNDYLVMQFILTTIIIVSHFDNLKRIFKRKEIKL